MKSSNTINTDRKLARAFGAHVFAAGYGGRYVLLEKETPRSMLDP